MTEEQIISYCNTLGMGDPIRNQVLTLHKHASCLLHDETKSCFISDVLEKDSTRLFTSLIFFTDKSFVEMIGFVSSPEIWVAMLPDELAATEIRSNDFNFEKAIAASRLSIAVNWTVGNGFVLKMQATGGNCDALLSVYKDLFKL